MFPEHFYDHRQDIHGFDLLPPVQNALSLHGHPYPFLPRLSPDLILMLVWEAVPHLFRFALDASLCFLPCWSRLTPVRDSVIVDGWSSVFLWTSGFLNEEPDFIVYLCVFSFLHCVIGFSSLSAMQINTCSHAGLEWKLGSRYKEISLKYRLFPPCARYSWEFVFAACFEDVISQAIALNPLCSYFSGQ